MTGKRIGLVIGNNYSNSNKELKYAVADANKIKEILENKDICFFDEVILLTNRNTRDAKTELERLFRTIHQGDLLFIYFSGHGKRSTDKKLCLFFEDTDENSLLATSLSFDFVNSCREYPNAEKASLIIVLDCCYSAAARTKDVGVADTLVNSCSTGMVLLTSTGRMEGHQTAIEDDQLKHSVFTNYLIEGLEKGYADKDDDGYIYIDDLYNYAYDMTRKRGKQSPRKEGSIEGPPIIIGKNPQKIKAKEYELRKKKFIMRFIDRLPPDVYNESLNILINSYENPSIMEKSDITVLRLLESLLENDLLPEKDSKDIRSYIETVQQLKEKGPIEKQQHEELHIRKEENTIREQKEQNNFHKYKRETEKLVGSKKETQKEIEKIKNMLINAGILYAPFILLMTGYYLNIIKNTVFVLLIVLSCAPSIHLIIRFIQSFIHFLRYNRENKKENQEEIKKVKNELISLSIIYLPIILLLLGVLLNISNGVFILLFFLSFSIFGYFIIRSALHYIQLLNDKS